MPQRSIPRLSPLTERAYLRAISGSYVRSRLDFMPRRRSWRPVSAISGSFGELEQLGAAVGLSYWEVAPAVRRQIVQYAAGENLTFDSALECIVMEGIKAIREQKPWAHPYVDKAV